MTWKSMNLEQRIHLIRAVYRHGMTAREIAAAIGTTKGSIIGIYGRNKDKLADTPLGLSDFQRHLTGDVTEASKRRHLKKKGVQVDKEEQTSYVPPATDWAAMGRMAQQRFPVLHGILDDTEYDEFALRVTLTENDGCMWPVNDGGPYLFCGHVKLKGSYCERHHVRSLGRGTEGERRAHRIGERHV